MFRSIKKRHGVARKVVRTTKEEDDESDNDDNDKDDRANNDVVSTGDEKSTTNGDDDNVDTAPSSSRDNAISKDGEDDRVDKRSLTPKKTTKKTKKFKKDKKKGKIRQPPATFSFALDDEIEGGGDIDDGRDAEATKTNKKRKWTGFGGGIRANVNIHDDDDDDNDKVAMDVDDAMPQQPSSERSAATSTAASSSYGKEALEALKMEQKRRQQRPPPPLPSPPPPPSDLTTGLVNDPTFKAFKTTLPESVQQQRPNDQNMQHQNHAEESYISLDGKTTANTNNRMEDETIMAGDEALAHVEQQLQQQMIGGDQQHGRQRVAFEDQQVDDAWEEQISRRALGSASKGTKTSTGSASRAASTTFRGTVPSKLVSLDELKQQLQSTLSTLQTRQEEITNLINRRLTDLKHARVEYQEQSKTLQKTGMALEEYQKLRNDLTLWCGALRDLQRKVRPVMEGFQDMLIRQLVDAGSEFQSWQDDSIAMLSEKGFIERVLGRQPVLQLKDETVGATMVDEFGRDIQSQYLRDREARCKRRMEQIQGDGNNDDESTLSSGRDSTWLVSSMYEDGYNEIQRSGLLQEALRVALQDLDPMYTAESQLYGVFENWQKSYPDEYEQCFASLSFGDLLSVLIQVEVCQSSWFPGMLDTTTHNDLAPYATNLGGGVLDNKFPSDSRSRAVEKALVPFLLKLLQEAPATFLFLPAQKSLLLSRLLADVMTCLEVSSTIRNKLVIALGKAMATSLNALAIPVCRPLNKNDVDHDKIPGKLLQFANQYMVELVSDMLQNMIRYFFPLLPVDILESEESDENGIHQVLNFINDTFLMWLSLLDRTTAKGAFESVWQALCQDSRQFLQLPSFFLLSTPLRAAAHAYKLPNV